MNETQHSADYDAGWQLPPCGHIECADRQSDSCPSRSLPPDSDGVTEARQRVLDRLRNERLSNPRRILPPEASES